MREEGRGDRGAGAFAVPREATAEVATQIGDARERSLGAVARSWCDRRSHDLIEPLAQSAPEEVDVVVAERPEKNPTLTRVCPALGVQHDGLVVPERCPRQIAQGIRSAVGIWSAPNSPLDRMSITRNPGRAIPYPFGELNSRDVIVLVLDARTRLSTSSRALRARSGVPANAASTPSTSATPTASCAGPIRAQRVFTRPPSPTGFRFPLPASLSLNSLPALLNPLGDMETSQRNADDRDNHNPIRHPSQRG